MATSSDRNEHRKRKGVSVAAAALSIALVAPLVQPTVTHRFTLAAESDNSVVASETGSVSGSVDPDAVDRVELVDPETQERREVPMDESGNLDLTDVPTGDYTVEVTPRDGYTAPAYQTVTVEKDQNTQLMDVTPTRDAGSVSGWVDPGAVDWVELVDTATGERREVSVDDNGNLNLGVVPTGDYTVVVTPADGYTAPADHTVTVEKDNNTELENVAPTRDTGSVSGSVDPEAVGTVELVDPETGERLEVPMDESGNLNLDQVPTSDYTVEVTPKDGYTATANQTVTVKKNQNTQLMDVSPNPSTVSGKIDGLPEGKSVTVTIGGQSATVDANGEYTIENVPAGEQTVEVSDLPGYSIAYPGTVTVSPEGTPSVDVTVTPVPVPVSDKIEILPGPISKPTTEEKTPATGSIVGKVIDDKGNPLPSTDGAGNRTPSKVTVTDGEGNQVGEPVETDENGEFTIPELPDGEYVVSVKTPEDHNDPKPQVVVVTDGQPTEVPPFVSAGPRNTEFEPVYPVTYVRVGEAATSVTPNFTRLINGREFYRQPLRTAGVAKFEIADERASLKDNGRVVFAAPQGAKPGDRFSVPVTVTYEDGTTDRTEAEFEAIQGDLADAYDPKYEVGRTAAPGEQVLVEQVGDPHLPEGTTFALDRANSSLNGWGIRVDRETGLITATAPSSGENGAEVAVVVSYSDGSHETIKAFVDPQVGNSMAATTPVSDAVVQLPVGVALDVKAIADLPDGTTFALDEFSNEDWTVLIDDTTGEITVVTNKNVKPTDRVVVPVRVTFPDGSQKIVRVTLEATESQADAFKPEYRPIRVTQGASAVARLIEPVGASYSLAGEVAGLRTVIDPTTGAITVHADTGATPGTTKIPVDARFADGSLKRIQAQVEVVGVGASDASQCEGASSGSSGSSMSSTSSCGSSGSSAQGTTVLAVVLGLLAAIGGVGWALYINQDAVRGALREFGINI
ncbi:Rib/alpha-like domain-containing protein [Corynebacterium lujinxingii]|uniref:alpha-amylase n=1 Tax=Corynebacterium lujinxingii TaxID=2763010 RepID=A0A7H0JY99_9CORY|nr:Rib/alpha-like domain-containing protein [Corynebacterium lujinxingii]MBC3178286.1 carboxypeptidase regulatory-like domain-containing protein [Corynebacterium lujinxingii]NNO10836.1 hypothetical protein [Corynebacterium lujinxingii]QNP90015.1 carboxypeptidase regulatory-like domain-containing protein [Corynebacterium lujinxingii]